MTRYRISFNEEHIVSGEAVDSQLMFWHGVIADPEYDAERVADRLARIRDEHRVHFERWGDRRFHFPPIFRVEKDESVLR